MESDNLDISKNLINEKLAEFISNFDNASERTKGLLHFQSVVNVSSELIGFHNSKANVLKESILEYFELVSNIDYSNDTFIDDIHDKRKKSLSLYNKHILPAAKYLNGKSDIKPDTSLNLHLLFGIILDLIIYLFISKSIAPLLTLLVVIRGIIIKAKRRKNGKIVSPFK